MSFKPFNPFVPPPQQKREEPLVVDKKGRPVDPIKAQRRKIARFLINPELGSGFQDMKQTHGLFLRLVCNVFLQIGLIDAAYPGISDEKKLNLRTMLIYAYNNLEYTREGMPRVLMFYSFIFSIAAMALAIMVFAIQLTGAGDPRYAHKANQPRPVAQQPVQQVAPQPIQQAPVQQLQQPVPQQAPQPVLRHQ
jgi:hypothetical protein